MLGEMKKRELKLSTCHKESLLPQQGQVSPEGPAKKFDDVVSELGFGFWHWLLIFICGIGSVADAMEVNLLSYLAPCAEEEWHLSDMKVSYVTGTVFIGEMLGACTFGILADRQGRKFSYWVALLLATIGGIATYFVESYWQLLLYRGVVGFGVAGGAFVAFDYLAETAPPAPRGKILQVMFFNWGLGSLLISGSALLFVHDYGWRVLSLVCLAPVALNVFLLLAISESPRWLQTQGRVNEAVEALQYGAKLNCMEIGEFTLLPVEKTYREGDVRVLFGPSLLKPTMRLCVNWVCFGFTYYSVILAISRLLEATDASEICTFDYFHIFITSSSEVLCPLLAMFFVDKSRVKTQLTCYFGAGIFVLLMGLNADDSFLTTFAFLARGMINVASGMTWTVTPEFYPTEIRTTAHAFFYLLSRVGAFFSSFWIYSMFDPEVICIGIAAICFLAAINTMFMEETTGRILDNIQGTTGREVSHKRLRRERTGFTTENKI